MHKTKSKKWLKKKFNALFKTKKYVPPPKKKTF